MLYTLPSNRCALLDYEKEEHGRYRHSITSLTAVVRYSTINRIVRNNSRAFCFKTVCLPIPLHTQTRNQSIRPSRSFFFLFFFNFPNIYANPNSLSESKSNFETILAVDQIRTRNWNLHLGP